MEKLTIAAEVQRTKAEERRFYHDHREKAAKFFIADDVL